KGKDIDLQVFAKAHLHGRIATQIHWDEFAAGRKILDQPLDIIDPVDSVAKFGVIDGQGRIKPMKLFGGNTLENVAPLMEKNVIEPLQLRGLHVPAINNFFGSQGLSFQKVWSGKDFRFHTFFHPYVCTFNENLIRYGVDGLLDPKPEK